MESWKKFHSGSKFDYEISIDGQVKNSQTGVLLKIVCNSTGYRTIKLQRKWFFIHRVVATHFIPNPNNYPIVCHKDNDINNNSADNLYWGTQSDNIKQSVRDGTHKGHLNFRGENGFTKAKRLGLPKPKSYNQYTKRILV